VVQGLERETKRNYGRGSPVNKGTMCERSRNRQKKDGTEGEKGDRQKAQKISLLAKSKGKKRKERGTTFAGVVAPKKKGKGNSDEESTINN